MPLTYEAQGRCAQQQHGHAPGCHPPQVHFVPIGTAANRIEAPFYNWPSTFGLLFGLGLHRRYLDDPDRFRTRYDTLLSCTGLDSAEALAAGFGIDVTDQDFWASSLAAITARIDDFEHLAHLTPRAI